MLIIKKEIKERKYFALLQYAYIRSDAFSFCVPDLFASIDAKSRSEEFIHYKDNIADFTEDLKPFLIKEYQSKEYITSLREAYQEVKIYRMVEDSYWKIMIGGHLSQWQYPEYPEDLCFFKEGKCWMRSIAHENLCEIYEFGELEKRIVKKILGLPFIEIPHNEEDIPRIDYSLS